MKSQFNDIPNHYNTILFNHSINIIHKHPLKLLKYFVRLHENQSNTQVSTKDVEIILGLYLALLHCENLFQFYID